MRIRRKRTALALVGACVAAVVGVTTAFGGSGRGGPNDAVWGGGHFDVTIGGFEFVRDFSVNVEAGRFGGADGPLVYGRNGVSGGVDEASCIAVSGNRAVIGGTTPAGAPFVWYAVDNGTPASAVRDQVTPLILLEPELVAQMPAGFPNVCPSPAGPIDGTPYTDLVGGDVVVRDVT